MDGRTDGWMYGIRMDGWMDEWTLSKKLCFCSCWSEAMINCSGCRIALLTVSRTYSHFKPFPAHIRTTIRFSHFFAQLMELHAQFCTISSIKTGISLDNWGEFRQKLGSVYTIGSSLDKNWVQFGQLGRV